MKKNMLKHSLAVVVFGLLCHVCLTAEQSESLLRPVGMRMISDVEKMQLKSSKSIYSNLYPDARTDEEEANLFEASASLSKDELQVKSEELKLKIEKNQTVELKEKSSLSNTSHYGAYHFANYVSPLGDIVRLEDGSEWLVCNGVGIFTDNTDDRFSTFDWYTTDRIIITVNHDWLTSYDYKLNNENTGEVVSVNLVSAPYYNGIFTHWIVAIDYIHKRICLEDGSVWTISVWDDAELKRMALEDTIIIGTNDSWFKSTRPNILINVDTMEYVKARCEF